MTLAGALNLAGAIAFAAANRRGADDQPDTVLDEAGTVPADGWGPEYAASVKLTPPPPPEHDRALVPETSRQARRWNERQMLKRAGRAKRGAK